MDFVSDALFDAPGRYSKDRTSHERVLRVVATMAAQTPRPAQGAIVAHLDAAGRADAAGQYPVGDIERGVLIKRARARRRLQAASAEIPALVSDAKVMPPGLR